MAQKNKKQINKISPVLMLSIFGIIINIISGLVIISQFFGFAPAF